MNSNLNYKKVCVWLFYYNLLILNVNLLMKGEKQTHERLFTRTWIVFTSKFSKIINI